MLGIDIGQVIISGDTDIPDQFFGEHFLSVPPVAGAFEAIAALVSKYGSGQVHLVSKCSEPTQIRTLKWLDHHAFYDSTSLQRDHVWFCIERKDKKAICEKIGITIFIDDRFSVLRHLTELDQLFLFNPSESELALFNEAERAENIKIVESWDDILLPLI